MKRLSSRRVGNWGQMLDRHMVDWVGEENGHGHGQGQGHLPQHLAAALGLEPSDFGENVTEYLAAYVSDEGDATGAVGCLHMIVRHLAVTDAERLGAGVRRTLWQQLYTAATEVESLPEDLRMAIQTEINYLQEDGFELLLEEDEAEMKASSDE